VTVSYIYDKRKVSIAVSFRNSDPYIRNILIYWGYIIISRIWFRVIHKLKLNSVALIREWTIPTTPTIPSDRRLLANLVPTFADRGCHVVSMTDPYGRILGFLDRSSYFSSEQLLNCTHEAEWTPFHTHHFSENLVAPGIEPGPLDL
jgi:hypothetical protein